MKFSRVHPDFVSAAHSYTRTDEPWLMDRETGANGRTPTGKVYGWKLFHYLTGGGMRELGRTLHQEVRSRRQNRFLAVAGILASAWLCMLVF